MKKKILIDGEKGKKGMKIRKSMEEREDIEVI